METRNWKNLRDMECPKCASPLLRSEVGYNCCSCEFKIREERFNEIINSMMQPTRREAVRDEVEDNLRGLSDL